jgi:hypothetical protein
MHSSLRKLLLAKAKGWRRRDDGLSGKKTFERNENEYTFSLALCV